MSSTAFRRMASPMDPRPTKKTTPWLCEGLQDSTPEAKGLQGTNYRKPPPTLDVLLGFRFVMRALFEGNAAMSSAVDSSLPSSAVLYYANMPQTSHVNFEPDATYIF